MPHKSVGVRIASPDHLRSRGMTATMSTAGLSGSVPRSDGETVSPALVPPPGNPRFRLMDALRAIAALSVLIYHVGFFGHFQQAHSYGFVLSSLGFGVAIFFVLSGFLLYRPFFNAEMTGAPRPRLRDFARRRVLRVVPAYWLALTVLATFPGLAGVFTDHWWRYYGFLQGYASQTLVRASGIPVAWSLGIEVSFYVALPFYAAATLWLSRSMSPARKVSFQLLSLTVLGGLSLLGGWVRLGTATPPLLLTFFDWFALGMALAVISVALQGRQTQPRVVEFTIRHPAACWGAALGLYGVLSLVVSSAPQNYLYSHAQAAEDHVLRGLIALLIVLPAVFGDWAGGAPRRLMSSGWMRWLGQISYGIFLWHLPLLIWFYAHGVHSILLLLVCTLGATVACACASYYLVELPLLRFKDRKPRLPSGPGSFSMVRARRAKDSPAVRAAEPSTGSGAV